MKGHGHDKPVFGCDECIAVGNRGTPQHPANGWTYYRVDVDKTLTSYYYVLAPSQKAAQEDADAVDLEDSYFDVEGPFAYANPVDGQPPPDEPLWTGGPDGDWDVTPKGEATG